ncbi:hypothetical protein RRG08_053976 [Elysia crispata]|uniref:Uncharacterized protein n=1 Tax=Elysia crispata TaxID=231223 RepID=A0AAE1DFS0_9GAST|nr:hypothetical protein RRG08_053976 [Elysia crispata]
MDRRRAIDNGAFRARLQECVCVCPPYLSCCRVSALSLALVLDPGIRWLGPMAGGADCPDSTRGPPPGPLVSTRARDPVRLAKIVVDVDPSQLADSCDLDVRCSSYGVDVSNLVLGLNSSDENREAYENSLYNSRRNPRSDIVQTGVREFRDYPNHMEDNNQVNVTLVGPEVFSG